MSVKTPPQYTTLQNQTAVAGGTWPQTLTLSPDLSVGGLNVVFQDGKVVGEFTSAVRFELLLILSAIEQQTPKGLFSSTGRLFWLQNADLDGVTSFSFQSGVFLHINFWTGSKLVAYVSL